MFRSISTQRFALIFGLITLMLASSGAVFAQSSHASIQGVITGSESPIEGAKVTARNTQSGHEWTATSSAQGKYFLLSVPSGSYELLAEATGFEPQLKTTSVTLGQKAKIDFNLVPGSLTEELVVTADVVINDLTNSDVSIPIRSEQMEKLPLNGRNFLSVATLAPGTKPAAGGAAGGGLTTGAGTSNALGFYVDGSDRKNEIVDGGMVGQFISSSNAFPLSAVKEYRVITQLYKAEFAKASGGVVTAATKSGSNDLGGELFFTYRDKSLNNKNHFAADKPDYQRDQKGFAIGGPIVKDRLHYFVSYEKTDVDEFYISPAAGDFSDLGGTFPTPQKQDLIFAKLTWQPSDGHYFDISVDSRDETNTAYWLWWSQPYSQDRGINFKNDVNNVNAKYQYTAGTALHEIRFNMQDYGWATETLANGQPGLRYPSMHIGPFSHAPQDWAQERHSLNYDVSWGNENHLFKAGIVAQRLRYQAIQQTMHNPQFDFATDDATTPYNGSIGFGDAGIEKYNTQLGLFIQDDWNVNERLTLNLGLRYDYESNMLNNDFVTPDDIRADLSQYFDDKYFSDGSNRKPFKGAIQPRVGFTYDLTGDGERFLTGGVGVFYDRTIWNVASDEALRYSYKVYNIGFSEDGSDGIQWDDSYYTREGLAELIASGQTDPPEIFLIPDDLAPPKSTQFTIGYKQQLTDSTLSVSYVGVRGSNETAVYDANANGQVPGYGKVNVWTDSAKSWFDAFYFFYDRPMKNKWFGQVSYTLGWADNQSDSLYYGYWRYTSEDQLVRAPAIADERHRLSLNLGYELPWNMQISGWGTFATGTPFEAISGTDDNNDGRTLNDYPEGKGRNSGRKADSKVLNLRLSKTFDLRQMGIQVYVDAFNVFDWTNYTSYYSNQQSAQFGQPNGAGDPRQIQLGGSLSF